MGQKESKKEMKMNLNEQLFNRLSLITGCSTNEIKKLHNSFLNHANSSHVLDKNGFKSLYFELKPEDQEPFTQIIDYIFSAFDRNKSGEIDFEEFIVTYLRL